MILIAFALPQESRDFRRTLAAARGRLGGQEIRLVHTGVGPVAAAATTAGSLAAERPEAMICAGFAGGLDPRLVTGDLLIAENYTSPELRIRAQALTGDRPRRFFGSLTSQPAPVESVAGKARLAADTHALAVDMETAAVAAACGAVGVPLLAVRAISDPADRPLPVPFAEWFDLTRQSPRRWGLVKYLLKHPDHVGPFADFLRGLPPARRALTDFLIRFLTDQ